MNQIRLTKTSDVAKVLNYLRNKYRLLSEAEIIKVALSEKYYREINPVDKEQKLREAYRHAMQEGQKIGDKLLAKRGLKRENMSEQEIYDTFLNTRKHNS